MGILVQEMIKVLFPIFCLFCCFFFSVRMTVATFHCKLPRKWGAVSHQAAGLVGRGALSAALKRRGMQGETYTWKRKKENRECRRQLDSRFPIVLFTSCPCLVGAAGPTVYTLKRSRPFCLDVDTLNILLSCVMFAKFFVFFYRSTEVAFHSFLLRVW